MLTSYIYEMRYRIAAIILMAFFTHLGQGEICAQGIKLESKNVKWPVDSLGNKGRNVVKWNMTPFLLWGSGNINFSYERILRSHRSISVNIGTFRLPSLTNLNVDSTNIISNKKRGGFAASFDYRRYFGNRNIRWAPDGLYWGLWTSYHRSNFENELTAMNDAGEFISVKSDGRVSIYAVGAELGYQFQIGKHFVIDLIMVGPAMARYSFNVNLQAESDIDDDALAKQIIDAIVERVPALQKLIDTGNLKGDGKLDVSTIGLRFMLQVGYLF